jgi:hypothetical protein
MVDLGRTEQEMLSEIGVPGGTAPADTRAPGKPWRLVGRTPADLLPVLTTTFCDCYAHVPARHVFDDLIYPVKKALGNAYKWGNRTDREKLLIVTSVMTPTGAVIKITDQGDGFDVRHVIESRSFTHGGSGVTHFHRTQSVISFADGGRTLLIRFLSDTGSSGTVASAAVADGAATDTRRIDFTDLQLRDQVKVKVVHGAEGHLVARKITLKPFEDVVVVEAPLQHMQDNGMVVRILGSTVRLSERTQIVDTDLGVAGPERLRAGDVVWLTGSYIPGEGLLAARVKIRGGRRGDTSELQGRIEAIDRSDRSFRVLGITVACDDRTELRGGPPPRPETESTPSPHVR